MRKQPKRFERKERRAQTQRVELIRAKALKNIPDDLISWLNSDEARQQFLEETDSDSQ